MKKILLLTSAIALSIATMAQVAVQPKWDFTLDRMLRGQHSVISPVTRVAGVEVTSVAIEVTDAAEVMNFIQEAGYKVTQITETTLTAIIPVNFVEQLATLQSVIRINGPKLMQPTMDKARAIAGIDAVHTNAQNEFETPFTGKGVIVGIIDQGFQYKHVAFLDQDGKSRVVALWNREDYPNDGQPVTDIPDSGQASGGGHGTHVTGIAAGSKIDGLNLHGVAPEADIVMIPSTFDSNEVLEDVRYIKNLAKKAGKPYVINMSFGSQLGSHDGLSLYNRTLSDIVSDNSGVFVCAAGNDGNNKNHTSHTFTEDNEVRYVFVNNTASYVYMSIWEQTGDGKEHITIEPCYYRTTGQMIKPLSTGRGASTTLESGIDSYSKKQNFSAISFGEELKKEVGATDVFFGLKITGKKGANVHIWNNSNLDDLYLPASVSSSSGVKKAQILVPDNEYLVMDGGTAEKAITVGSYNSGRAYWKPLNGGPEVGYSTYRTAGEISAFSSRGPVLTKNAIKPTVSAPGAVIMSALNKYTSGFSKNNDDVFASVKTSVIKEFFYGANQGTSMSAPFVTGVIALWYQANPNLTHQQIMDIIAETSINDEFTAEAGQDAWGYGKINAYEGLKKALLLATDINDIYNTDAPVSFQKSNNAWRILFNNSEAYANIRVTDLNGRLVAQQALQQAQRGEETVVSLETLPAGVYLINVTTAKANITRKVIKK